MKRFELLRTEPDERKLNINRIKMLCGIGIPMGLQYSITAIGTIILQRAVNTLGSTAVAAMTAGSKISMFFCCPFDAMGSTMATYGGQNVGAGRIDRLSKGLGAISILGIGYSVIAFMVIWFGGTIFVSLFTGDSVPLVIEKARLMLVINSSFYIPLAFVNIVRFLIQGMGYSQLAIVSGVCEMAARAVIGFAFVPMLGFTAACFASPIAWLLADVFLFPAYFYIENKMKKRCTVKNI